MIWRILWQSMTFMSMEQRDGNCHKISQVVVKCRKLLWCLSQIVVTFFLPSPSSRRPLLVRKPRHASVLSTHSDTQAVPTSHCARMFKALKTTEIWAETPGKKSTFLLGNGSRILFREYCFRGESSLSSAANSVSSAINSVSSLWHTNNSGKKTRKHKQICGIVPGLGGCQKYVYVFFSGHSLGRENT